jgi:hypothetical protein
MSKYIEVLRDVEEIFATSAWTSNSIPAFPLNYEVTAAARSNREFVIIEVLPGRNFTNYAKPGVKGQVIIQIYTEAGLGTARANAIADILDGLLQNKELTRGTLTSTSSMAILGVDTADEYLFRTDYTVNFTKY